VFDVQELLPAVGQAALAVECRESDEELLAMLAALDDESSRISITAERAFLRELGAGCRLPVGAYASIEGAGLRLRAMLGDGRDAVHRLELAGGAADAERLGKAAAQELSRRAGVSGDG
jgi:hydroxymethylbilane synthase